MATADLKFPIKLENLSHKHGQFSSYEPELYPGLIYRMVLPRVVLLIFVNGKIVLTGKNITLYYSYPVFVLHHTNLHDYFISGAKNRQELKDALHNIYPILKSFRKQ